MAAPRDPTTEIMSIHRSLGRIEGKQDQLLNALSDQRGRIEKIEEHHSAQDSRINKIQSRLNYYAGGLAALGVVLVFIKDRVIQALG